MAKCTITLQSILTGLANGAFKEMGVSQALGYGGASDTTLLWEVELTDIHVLFDPQSPAEGFQVFDYSDQWQEEINQSKCWQVLFTGEVIELY